ncbi:A/G-specific adenine glycosylase [Halalkalibacter krulwichiae]|uniref:Adenine DNA glycosylase n=1 Tax=Halalkalibacter krulwichiae TaxID=199441 RepID=A0A1X9MA28_9BACI|nr:A/G-specific adenine glycosylase [Halalkalibacter krulwichiae]ARK29023.1 putative A/G-specific adenine glycosylase YfhQ [Halalkalibacter krulwichiae]
MKQELLNDFDITGFQESLVSWFLENQRELPWRESRDAYRVWVSEIMLQQTRVETVIPYYQAFMREFPTAEALAEAEEERILKAWEGLGYYSRVRNLQSAVREVVEKYQGRVPDTRKEISSLKGVGPYTAGAILSIAYGKPEPAVDGNVMRVLSRVFIVEEDIAKPATRKIFETILYDLISKEDPSAFNQGLMELGALICTPTSPGCLLCPVRAYCRANQEGIQSQLPIKSKKKKQTMKHMAAVVVKNQAGEILIEKRPEKGLLARLWQFPNIEVTDQVNHQIALSDFLEKEFDLKIEVQNEVQKVEHVFSHLIWNITVYEAVVINETKKRSGRTFKWVKRNEIEEYAFPVSHQKIIQQTLFVN